MDIKKGDIIERRVSGCRHEVLLIANGWAWVQRTGFDRPDTYRLSSMDATFKAVCPFEVGDMVEFYVGYSACGTIPGQGKVLCIHEDRAWVYFDGRSVPLSPLITSLQKVKA